MATNFWTDAKYQPMQQFRYDVNAMLYKGDFSETVSVGNSVGKISTNRVSIDKELIKAVNMPDVSVGYDNDAANIGSGGPSIESQDPQMAELELQLYMTPQLAQDIHAYLIKIESVLSLLRSSFRTHKSLLTFMIQTQNR